MTARLHLLDGPPEVRPDTQVVVREALVPLRWWRSVPVRMQETATLTEMERFVLEAVLAFGSSAPPEFEEITDLPAHMLPVLGRRLVAAGALDPAGVPRDVALCRSMMVAEQLYRDRAESVDVVVLPATGEIVVLDKATAGDDPLLGWERARVKPAGKYPVDATLSGRSLTDILVGTAGITGVESDAVAFPQGLCPVFRCTAQVTGDSGAGVRLSIGDGAPAVLLPNVKGLVQGWLGVDRVLADRPLAVWRALLGNQQPADVPPTPRQASRSAWRIGVTGRQANLLSNAGRNLGKPAGLAVETAEVIVEVALTITAADRSASAAIAVDRAINAAVSEGSTASTVHNQLAEEATRLPHDAVGALAPTKVRDRAWHLGHYRLAYALRERDDFDYA
ncbi:hypothetical protein WEI85_04240 [Actinomycetes bacterium KLBMP 9797]